jgi:hypothetical protein
MGLTPATGSEIAMSCVYDAFGFPLPTLNISLNGVLGSLRQPPQALGVSAIPASSQTTLSADMGGLTTPDDYTCSGTLYYTLNGCTGGQPTYDTTITPILTNQRYFDPVTSGYWTWDNAAGTSSPQQTVSGTIIIQSGQSGCP